MKLLKIGIAAAAAATLALSTASTAIASTPTNSRAVDAVISAFSASHNEQGLQQFRAAPKTTQLKVAEALSSKSDISKLVSTGKAVQGSVASRLVESRSSVASPSYPVYDVTSEFHVSATILGITIATYHQVYTYETGNNQVLQDYSCRGYWDGFTGIDTFDYSVSNHVSGGYGYCTVYDQVSLVYKGLGATYEKKGDMEVDYDGIVSWSLVND